jgi:VanZ family protein
LRLLVDERAKRALFVLWGLGWLALFTVSLRPIEELPYGMSDKLLHLLGYAAMTAGVAGFCHERRGVLGWAGFAVLLGGLVEVAQHFLPPRTMELGDFLANGIGAVIGAALALAWIGVVVTPLRRAAAAPA